MFLRNLVLSLLLITVVSVSKASKHPNVILILTDDQGYGDLSCHGNPVLKTPNIDRLYNESVRLTDFHVDPTCAPTRSALTTGKYSHHVGVWHTIAGGNHLRKTETTMAEIFKNSGYTTALFGKWHLGSNYPYRPIDRGFDEWLGNGDGGTGTTDDWFYNDRVNDMYWHNGEREYREGYAPDVFFNSAIDYIKLKKESRKPFFIELATYLPHNPHTVPDVEMVKEFEGKVPEHVAYFFAGIKRIDENIGRLRNVLKEIGEEENTVFIFMTDNGSVYGVKTFNAGMRGRKGQVYEGGHRVPFFLHYPKGKIDRGRDIDQLTAHIDVLPTLIDLCNLKVDKKIKFDGRSLVKQMVNKNEVLPERTLFVETQRNFKPVEWQRTAGMKGKWRLVDNRQLYNIKMDPAQEKNIIDQHPEIVEAIRTAYGEYWAKVTPGDRDVPRHIIGNSNDIETFLSCSDWYLPQVPWNHAQVAKGREEAGVWEIEVEEKAEYCFEVRRWPREANAPIQGIPTFTKPIDAYKADGAVEKLIYGDEINALQVHSIRLQVGNKVEEQKVFASDNYKRFQIKLDEGINTVKAVFLDEKGNVISGAYYVYVTKTNFISSRKK